MIHNNQILGFPQIIFAATKVEIQDITPSSPGAFAYATDTKEYAFYNGSVWVFHGESAPSGATWANNETPSGLVNGVNTSFTLAHTPAAWIQLYLNGVLLEPGVGNDYTLSGTDITMTFAPQTGDKLRTYYMY